MANVISNKSILKGLISVQPEKPALKPTTKKWEIEQGVNETPEDTEYRASLTYVIDPERITPSEISQGYMRYNIMCYPGMKYEFK
jgi:hypothetical protein